MKMLFSVEGVKELIAAFGYVEQGVADLRQLGTWKAVKTEFYKIQKEKFDKAGPGWKALSPKYAAVKNKQFNGPSRILVRSGEMYKDFTAGGSPQEQEQSLDFSFNSPAGYHMSKEARSKNAISKLARSDG